MPKRTKTLRTFHIGQLPAKGSPRTRRFFVLSKVMKGSGTIRSNAPFRAEKKVKVFHTLKAKGPSQALSKFNKSKKKEKIFGTGGGMVQFGRGGPLVLTKAKGKR